MLNIDNEKLDKAYKKKIAVALKKRMEEDKYFKKKCDESSKTLDGALSYVKSEAEKQKEDNYCAVIEDNTVYDWCFHYIMEDNLNFEKKQIIHKKAKSTPVKNDEDNKNAQSGRPEIKNSSQKKQVDQLLFDF